VTELQRLEVKVLELSGAINLRPTLDRAADLGAALAEVKGLLPHGQWLPWLKRVGISKQSASNYCTVFREVGKVQGTGRLTIEQFLRQMREARINGKKRERQQVRDEVASRLGKLPDTIQLHRADCRKFDWPTVDCLATDPPWASMPDYRWLAGMAMEKLRPGGLMLLQCGTGYLASVMRIMTDAGLMYRWTLAVVYAEMRRAKPTSGRYLPAWNPILLFSKGDMPHGDVVGDVYTVRHQREAKTLHDWAQPVEPLAYWMGRLIRPGSLVGDPFAGSGTTGVACRLLALEWIGTEIDGKAYKVAKGRLVAKKAV